MQRIVHRQRSIIQLGAKYRLYLESQLLDRKFVWISDIYWGTGIFWELCQRRYASNEIVDITERTSLGTISIYGQRCPSRTIRQRPGQVIALQLFSTALASSRQLARGKDFRGSDPSARDQCRTPSNGRCAGSLVPKLGCPH